jgi:hypothetical protein
MWVWGWVLDGWFFLLQSAKIVNLYANNMFLTISVVSVIFFYNMNYDYALSGFISKQQQVPHEALCRNKQIKSYGR